LLLADGSEYNVFPLGVETPNHGVRTLLKIQLVYSHKKEALFLHQRDGISLTP
jgi:hypothetical protein